MNLHPDDEKGLIETLADIEAKVEENASLKAKVKHLEQQASTELVNIKKAAFEEGIQHTLDVIDASIKGHAVVFKSTNPKFFALMNLILQMRPRQSAEIQVEALKNKREHMNKCLDEFLSKETTIELTKEQAARVLELVREGKQNVQADREANALPTTIFTDVHCPE